MPKPPAIIGIDPGTTSAYAILDTDGKVVDLYSSKELGLSELLKRVIARGMPIVVGTDKAKVPELIGQFAAKTGCNTIAPDIDLKIDEKKLLTKNHNFNNAHEMDALASALYAYSHYLETIKKIRKYAKDMNKGEMLNELIVYVIKEGVPIKNAAEMIGGKDEETRVVRKAVHERKFEERDFLNLYTKVKELEKDNLLLKQYSQSLGNKLAKAESENSKLRRKEGKKQMTDSKRIESLFSFKEKRINEINSKLQQKDEEVEGLKATLNRANNFISRINNRYVIKKLKNLGISEFEKKENALNISDGDIIWVENPNIYNEKTLNAIQDKIKLVICTIKPTKAAQNKLGVEFIPSSELKMEEFADFACLEKKEIEYKIKSKDMLKKIVEEYKSSRK